MNTIELNLNSLHLTEESFSRLCADNPDLRFELNTKGDLIIIPPTGGETGNINSEISYQLQGWSRRGKSGLAFDSSTGFKLPNGAIRSPDASWVSLERWNALTIEEKKQFPPLCPDFVIELLSPSDNLKITRDKMREYIDNGTSLGWLIDRNTRQVEIYRREKNIEIVSSPLTLSGENILLDFVLDLRTIW